MENQRKIYIPDYPPDRKVTKVKKPSENRLCRNPLKKEKQKLCGSWQDHKPLDFP
jgi:hypothetical protein